MLKDVYSIIKTDIDKYILPHPKALRNVLNIKKLVYVPKYQNVTESIRSHRHVLLGQDLTAETSRSSILQRIRKWYIQDFHIIPRPLVNPPVRFLQDARQYFENPERRLGILHGEYTSPTNLIYHVYVIRTTNRIRTDIPGYVPNTTYLLIATENIVVDVQPL